MPDAPCRGESRSLSFRRPFPLGSAHARLLAPATFFKFIQKNANFWQVFLINNGSDMSTALFMKGNIKSPSRPNCSIKAKSVFQVRTNQTKVILLCPSKVITHDTPPSFRRPIALWCRVLKYVIIEIPPDFWHISRISSNSAGVTRISIRSLRTPSHGKVAVSISRSPFRVHYRMVPILSSRQNFPTDTY